MLKFFRSLIEDKIKSLQKELIWILEDAEKYYPSIIDIHPFGQLAINLCLLKIAILEAILGKEKK